MDRFRELVAAQGGDLSQPLPIGAHTETITAPRGGTMGDIDAMAVGLAVWRLGAGRAVPGERVQFGAGLRIHRRPGEPVAAGRRCSRCTPTPRSGSAGALAELDGGWSVGDKAPDIGPLIIDRIMPVTTPLTLDSIRRAPKALLHDHLDGGLRPATVLDLAEQTGYDDLPATDVDGLANVLPHCRAQRIARALPGAVRPHGRRHADAGGAVPGGLRVRRGSGRRQRRVRRDPVRPRTAHRPRAVAGRGRRRGAGGFRRRREGRQQRGPRRSRCAAW